MKPSSEAGATVAVVAIIGAVVGAWLGSLWFGAAVLVVGCVTAVFVAEG